MRNLAATTLILLALAICSPAPASELEAQVREKIFTLFSLGQRFSLPIERAREDLARYYLEDGQPLLWVSGTRQDDLITRLRQAEDDGLRSTDYPVDFLTGLSELHQTATLQEFAEIELWFSAHFLKYATHLRAGRTIPRQVDPEVFVQEKTIAPYEALNALAGAGSVEAFVNSWQPPGRDYVILKELLRFLRSIKAEGGWQSVSGGEPLKPGDTGPRVVELRTRLAADGFIASSSNAADIFDQGLTEALIAFQRRHGLEPDGIVGKRTLLQLNISVDQRIRQVIATMERQRWMPEVLGSDYILVNIPAFEMRHFKNGQLIDVMDVIVGRDYRRTPVFSETMKYVEINPWWTVPVSIATKDKLPVLKSNPYELEAQGFVAYQGDAEVPLTAINWAAVSASNFPMTLRQRPGPSNALGRIKFMLPNPHNIYLHDTPSRELFARAQRDFSSGCIRLQRPLDLAEQLLDEAGWNRPQIEATVSNGRTKIVNLPTPLPVYITYSTAWVDEAGVIHFAPDLYRRDEKLLAALDGRPVPW